MWFVSSLVPPSRLGGFLCSSCCFLSPSGSRCPQMSSCCKLRTSAPKWWQCERDYEWTVYHINVDNKISNCCVKLTKKKTRPNKKQHFEWLLGQFITTNSSCLCFSTMAITEAPVWRRLEINAWPFHNKNPLTFAVILIEVIIESIMS